MEDLHHALQEHRQQTDNLANLVRSLRDNPVAMTCQREIALAITKLQEARMWLTMALKESGFQGNQPVQPSQPAAPVQSEQTQSATPVTPLQPQEVQPAPQEPVQSQPEVQAAQPQEAQQPSDPAQNVAPATEEQTQPQG